MAGKLKTRVNSSGYKQFWDEDEQRWVFTHRRVAEKKLGREPVPGEEVHHINGDKEDNRSRNLVVLKESIHDRIHRDDPDACFRCGRSDHWAEDCDAATDFEGNAVDEDDLDDDEEYEDDLEGEYDDDEVEEYDEDWDEEDDDY